MNTETKVLWRGGMGGMNIRQNSIKGGGNKSYNDKIPQKSKGQGKNGKV